MIKLERKIPLVILKLRALLRRIPPNHPKRKFIEEELAKRNAGFYGEQSVDYHLSFLPSENYFIFHGLRLQNEQKSFFQMDTLIVSPKFIVILEIKNILGTLYFDPTFNQLIRTLNDLEEAFGDPVTQVKRHKEQLINWLEKYNFPVAPIITFVVNSNSNAVLKTAAENKEIPQIVINAPTIPIKLKNLDQFFKKDIYEKAEMKKMSSLLIKKNTIADMNVMEFFKIAEKDILTGVCCPKCQHIPMSKTWGKWICINCGYHSNSAHFQALEDYARLIKPSITNTEFRNFLHLSNRSSATSMLASLNLKSTGSYKDRKYLLTFPD